uniref:Uncharacterized protein n=1 Tax=Arundo donax TaxID=35708 RepID=A0A0A9HJW4_ARUDO
MWFLMCAKIKRSLEPNGTTLQSCPCLLNQCTLFCDSDAACGSVFMLSRC